MKKYLLIITAALLTGLTSCVDLDLYPLEELSDGSFWKTPKDAEMAVSDLAVPVQSAIQGLDAGEVSKVFSLNGAYAQAKVLSKTTSSDNLAEIIDPAVVAKIRDGLRMQRVGNKIEEYITGLEKKAIVTIR